MKVRCVCDLCNHGTDDKKCYLRGVEKCFKNGVYKDFELKHEIDWKARYEELDQYVRETYGD